MDLTYLVDTVLPERKKEIEEGKNASTARPLYVVLELVEHCCSGHSDYSIKTNLRGLDSEFGYIDTDSKLQPEDRLFREEDKLMISPEEVTRFYTDRFVAFFLTRKAAEDYLEYQSHNLTKPYIYTFNVGYRNKQMDALFSDER